MRTQESECYLIDIVLQVRKDHPGMNCRDMYFMIQPSMMGRDKFEAFCFRHGFTVERKVNYIRTTDSSGVIRFDNLLLYCTLTCIDQAYSSDITYFQLNGKFYYLTFILDCFSRRILGHSVSLRLTTECTTLPALKMAIKTRGNIPEGIIFHSDGGGQYYDKEFLNLTSHHGFKNSMCEYAYENGKAERINGIIKNNYLRYWAIKNYEDLIINVDRAVSLYNEKKPHKALKRMPPVNFEKNLLNLQKETKLKVTESLEAITN